MKNSFVYATHSELQQIDIWVREHLLEADDYPFSFVYDGQPSSELLKVWEKTCKTREIDACRTEYTIVFKEEYGLEVKCVAVQNHKYSEIEWTVYFTNCSDMNSKMLSNVNGVDCVFLQSKEYVQHNLYYFNGDFCSCDSYEPKVHIFYEGIGIGFSPHGGRPTNMSFPYYKIQSNNRGILFVLSWQGQWETRFDKKDGGLRIIGRQEELCTYLQPGESIRTPMPVILFYEGDDYNRSQNIWRRWFIEFNMPRVDGELIKPFYANYPGRIFNEMEKATEENLKAYADLFLDHGISFDYLWIDAGWYDMGSQLGWPHTGTWKVDKARFPNGLRAVTDYVRSKARIKTILWFEPERVTAGTELYNEHIEWCLPCNEDNTDPKADPNNLFVCCRLLDLGNDQARLWLTRRVNALIKSEGIDFYRQDFNMDPLTYWRGNDKPGRLGILENHHCTGYLKFWDSILESNPGIIIDSCASGGRRNDLETMRRSLPLHKTDYNYGDLTRKQGFHYTLFQWFPFFGSMDWPADQSDIYYQRSSFLLSFHGCEDVFQPWMDFDKLATWMNEWRDTAHCFYGDYYPLTPFSSDDRQWIGWQFHMEEENEGIVQMFVRAQAPYLTASFVLNALNPDTVYAVKDFNTGLVTSRSGKSLMEDGLYMTITKRPGSMLFHYQKA